MSDARRRRRYRYIRKGFVRAPLWNKLVGVNCVCWPALSLALLNNE